MAPSLPIWMNDLDRAEVRHQRVGGIEIAMEKRAPGRGI
jgi:hypothetical protein